MTVYCNHKLVGKFVDDAALNAFMARDGYWPNTWTISDHGNVHHYHLDCPGVSYPNCEKGCQLPDEENQFDEESDYVIC